MKMVSSSSSSIYFPILRSIFTKVNLKSKEEGRSGTTGTGPSKKDLQRGRNEQTKNMLLERRGAQCKLEAGAILS